MALIHPATDTSRPSTQAQPNLADPLPSTLAAFLAGRLASEKGDTAGPLPKGVTTDLRPKLPRIGGKALGLYMQRRAVDSYPLIFTALALAHPN